MSLCQNLVDFRIIGHLVAKADFQIALIKARYAQIK